MASWILQGLLDFSGFLEIGLPGFCSLLVASWPLVANVIIYIYLDIFGILLPQCRNTLMPQISCKQKVVVHSLVTKNLEIHSFIHAFIDSFPHSLIHSFGSTFTCGAGVVVPTLKKGLNTQCNARLEITSKYDAHEKISDLKTMQKRIFDHRKETGFCPKDRK